MSYCTNGFMQIGIIQRQTCRELVGVEMWHKTFVLLGILFFQFDKFKCQDVEGALWELNGMSCFLDLQLGLDAVTVS